MTKKLVNLSLALISSLTVGCYAPFTVQMENELEIEMEAGDVTNVNVLATGGNATVNVDVETETTTGDTGEEIIDTGTEEVPVEENLELITFFSAPAGVMEIEPGTEEVYLGSWTMMSSLAGVPITVDERNLVLYISDDAAGGALYHAGSSVAVDVTDFVDDCKLINRDNNTVFAGPVSPDVGGTLNFSDTFFVYWTPWVLDVVCDLNELAPVGAGLAVNESYAASIQDSIHAHDGNGNLVTISNHSSNGTASAPGLVVHIVEPEPDCSFPVELTDGSIVYLPNELEITLNSGTPSGSGFMPEYQEVLRFDVTSLHPECPDMTLAGLDLQALWSENETGWLPTGFNIYNLWTLGITHPVTSTNEIMDGLGTVIVPLAEVIPAGQTYTYAVYANTEGASSTSDDVLQVNILADSMSYGPTGEAVTYNAAHDPVVGQWLQF